MELKKARNIYGWLWISPMFTIPTLLIINFLSILGKGYQADKVNLIIAILVSGLWHFILIFPSFDRDSKFIRWHGRQALLLALVRTALPLLFVLAFGVNYETLIVIPILIGVWFFGTLWAQLQASRVDCTLMRWTGHEDELPDAEVYKNIVQRKDPYVKNLIYVIKYSPERDKRRKALSELQALGLAAPTFGIVDPSDQDLESLQKAGSLLDIIRSSPNRNDRKKALLDLKQRDLVESLWEV